MAFRFVPRATPHTTYPATDAVIAAIGETKRYCDERRPGANWLRHLARGEDAGAEEK